MKKKTVLSLLILSGLYAHSTSIFQNENNKNHINYYIPLTIPKQKQIKQAIKLKQYLYDLTEYNKILSLLYSDKIFKSVSETVELQVKNPKSYYTYDYIENILKVLNGVDPYNDLHILKNKGYIKYITDIYNNYYKLYLNHYPVLINKNFNILEENIENNLKLLNRQYKLERNIKPVLKNIFDNLINVFKEIYTETKELQQINIIKPFDRYSDYKYKMPSNWAQYHTYFSDILNFALNGAHKYGYMGILDYYKKYYYNDTDGLKILTD